MGQFYQVYYHEVKALLACGNLSVAGSHEVITTPKRLGTAQRIKTARKFMSFIRE